MNVFFVWFIAIMTALLSGWLFKSGDLAILFAGFVIFCFSATLAGYQLNRMRTARGSHSFLSSLPRGSLGIGALLMCIPAFLGYLIP